MNCNKMETEVSKELTAKRKALASTEKRLAKLAAECRELTAEVDRLEMLEKSLKAVNEKTAPPREKEFVYVPYYQPYTFAPYTVPTITTTPAQPWNNPTITWQQGNISGDLTSKTTVFSNSPETYVSGNFGTLTSGNSSLQ